MELKKAFGLALRQFRNSKGLTQEDFSRLSSRTYMSTLERGQKMPKLDEVDDLSRMIGIHPVTLLAGCYLNLENELTMDELLDRVRDELQQTLLVAPAGAPPNA